MKISIITINYNNLYGLIQTVESVTKQTFTDFEYILIDGASTDGSVNFLKEKAKNIDIFVSEVDSGIYNAMNKGIKLASGEYILFLNSGDFFQNKDVLQHAISALTDFDFVYFDLCVQKGTNTKIISFDKKLSFSNLLAKSLPHPATFIKKSLFFDYGFYDEQYKIVSDWKFFIERICLNQCTYSKVPKVLSVFNTDGISSNPENQQLINIEKQHVLATSFSTFIDDVNLLSELKITVDSLRRSRKIKFLIRLKMLNPF